MKQKLFIFFMVVLLVTSCNLPSSITPTPQVETPIVIATNTVSSGGAVTLNNVSFTIPLGVAKDALPEMVAASSAENSPGEVAPAHLKFELTGYQVQDRFHKPQILVYPTEEYAQAFPNALEQIQKLKDILAGSPLTLQTMPAVPSFNAVQQIASKMKVINFQSGRGVRFLTQYAQYVAPINNQDLFYHFQGLTGDGKYYIIAILPVTSSILAETPDQNSPVPLGGVPIPTATGNDLPTPDQAYYESVTKALDAMYEDSFNPSLFQLDALIQSITVTP